MSLEIKKRQKKGEQIIGVPSSEPKRFKFQTNSLKLYQNLYLKNEIAKTITGPKIPQCKDSLKW